MIIVHAKIKLYLLNREKESQIGQSNRNQAIIILSLLLKFGKRKFLSNGSVLFRIIFRVLKESPVSLVDRSIEH